MRIRMNDDREQLHKRLQDATGENTKAGAIDAAAKHFLNDLSNKERIAGEFNNDQAEALSTPWLPIDRETRIGSND